MTYGGGYDPNAQYGGGGVQYGGLGGPPPKKNMVPVISVVAIVVLLLGGLGFSGFVSPGFFLADDKKEASDTGNGSNNNSKQDDNGGSDVEAFANKLVSAANDQDKSTLRDMKCENADEIVTQAIDAIDNVKSAELDDVKEKSSDEYVVTINIKHEDGTDPYDAIIQKDGGDWCWQGFEGDDIPTTSDDAPTVESSTDTSAPAPPPGGGGSEGEQFVQSFLDKLNAGDGAGANTLLCPDSTSQSDVSEAASKGPSLSMDPAGTQADATYVGTDLTGTLGGTQVTSARTSAFLEDAGWCIYTFYAF